MSLSTNSNVGDTDRYIRIALGCALIIWGLVGGPYWVFLLGGLLLATALIHFCPLWFIFKINTRGAKKE